MTLERRGESVVVKIKRSVYAILGSGTGEERDRKAYKSHSPVEYPSEE